MSVAQAAEVRAGYGLRADKAFVSTLLGSPGDVGTPRWGIPMTAAEEAQLDLIGRMTFADAVDRLVMPQLRASGTFAGLYMDQLDGGKLVVMTTGPRGSMEREIASLLPADNPGFTVVPAAVSEGDLLDAFWRAPDAFARRWDDAGFVDVGVDTINNRILLTVSAKRSWDLDALGATLTDDLGVPVAAVVGEPSFDVDCTSRDHCHDPMWSGARLYQGVVDSVPECTQGFHISIAGNEHFVAAGHCGFTSVSNEWIHPPLGVMATEGPSLYRQNGQDIRYFNNFADVQASDNIYGCCTDGVGLGSPVLNETLCASLGRTQATRCGRVLNTWFKWKSNNWDIWGARIDITANFGDSGSPVYRNVANQDNQAVALGALDRSDGAFARLDTSLNEWGATVVR